MVDDNIVLYSSFFYSCYLSLIIHSSAQITAKHLAATPQQSATLDLHLGTKVHLCELLHKLGIVLWVQTQVPHILFSDLHWVRTLIVIVVVFLAENGRGFLVGYQSPKVREQCLG